MAFPKIQPRDNGRSLPVNRNTLSHRIHQILAGSRFFARRKSDNKLDSAREAGNQDGLPQNTPQHQRSEPPAIHRVYMTFVYRDGWRCRFHDEELSQAAISRIFVFRDKERIYEIAKRGHGLTEPDAGDTLDKAIAAGRGGIWLRLTHTQYLSLKQPKSGFAA